MKTKQSTIALGTWSWGAGFAGGDQVFGNHLGADELAPVFDAALRAGLNVWDTATVYGMGSSEEILGQFVSGVERDKLVISTKFTPQIADMYDNDVEKMADASMERLGVNRIDIYWIHNPMDVERWTKGLIPLLRSGKVGRVGLSNHNLAQIQRAQAILEAEGFGVVAVQNHYSILYRSSEYGGILEYCQQQNIEFWAYMVLEQGALSGKYTPQHPMPANSARGARYNPLLPQLEILTKAMGEIGVRYQASPAQIAIAWALAKGTMPIIGATSVQQVEEAAHAATIQLTAAEMEQLEQTARSLDIDTRGEWEQAMD